MAALVPYQPLEQAREKMWADAKRVEFATIDGSLCASPFGGGAWFPVVPSDPAEAFETLIARGVLPQSFADDPQRAFVHTDRPDDGWGDTRDALTPHPPTIPDLVAWASLGAAAILRAEELARETVRRLRPWGAPQTERVVWCVRTLSNMEDEGQGTVWHYGEGRDVLTGGITPHGDLFPSVEAIWESGLALAPAARGLDLPAITAEAVTLVVPPVGAP